MKKQHLVIAAILVVFIGVIAVIHVVLPSAIISSIHESHISGNVPPQESFDAFLRRDLIASIGRGTTTVEYQLLRKDASQVGLSFPKYFAWVRAFDGTTLIVEGAARLTAVQKRKFDVQFLSKPQIRARPSDVGLFVPPAFVAKVIELAGVASE